MTPFEEFEQSLHQILAHFRNPTYQPPELIWSIIEHQPEHELEAIQNAIIQTIERLKPITGYTPRKQLIIQPRPFLP